MKLVKFSENFSNDLYVVGFQVMEDSEFESFKEELLNIVEPFELKAGEDIIFEYLNGEELLEVLEVEEVIESDLESLLRLFPGFEDNYLPTFGFTGWVEVDLDQYDDEFVEE